MKQQKITLATTVGAARLERNRPMRAVHRFVSTSTINAIEHDRMCPSVSVLDTLATGLGLPVGVWDDLYLDRTTEPREAVTICYGLLNRSAPPFACVKRIVRRLIELSRARYQRMTAELCLYLPMRRGNKSTATGYLDWSSNREACTQRGMVGPRN